MPVFGRGWLEGERGRWAKRVRASGTLGKRTCGRSHCRALAAEWELLRDSRDAMRKSLRRPPSVSVMRSSTKMTRLSSAVARIETCKRDTSACGAAVSIARGRQIDASYAGELNVPGWIQTACAHLLNPNDSADTSEHKQRAVVDVPLRPRCEHDSRCKTSQPRIPSARSVRGARMSQSALGWHYGSNQ